MSNGPLLRPGDRIVFVGDSITADPEGYVSVCAQVLARAYPQGGIEVVNAGRPGETAADMARRFEREALGPCPTWVAISAGVNDAALAAGRGALGARLEAAAAAIEDMCVAGEAAGVRVALCTPTAFEDHWAGPAARANEFCAALAERLTDLATARGYVLVPMFAMCRRFAETQDQTGLDASRRWLTTDGVHMAPRGRYLMALTMLAALRVGAGLDDTEERSS